MKIRQPIILEVGYNRSPDKVIENSCQHFREMDSNLKRETMETTRGCFECLEIGGTWVDLRQCLSCGLVRCCDSSSHKHASKHFAETNHPVAVLMELMMEWCYIHEILNKSA